MTAKTRAIQEKAQTREMIWAIGMILLGVLKNPSLLTDLEEILLFPLNLWNALVIRTGWAAIAVALTTAAVLGIAGTEILKVMKKKWNHLYLFYLILSMAITVAMGELINRVIPLNQILTGGLLYIVFLLLNWQITSHVSR